MSTRFRALFVAVMVLFFVLPIQAKATGLADLLGLQSEKSLSFYNTHTKEEIDIRYFYNGSYDSVAMAKINDILRDHRNGHVHSIDKGLLNLLHDVKTELSRRYPDQQVRFHIISGYRSQQTNDMLRARGGGQGKNSRHMSGDAIDVRVPGIPTSEIRDVAWCKGRGGVGYYKGSDFVHIDTYDKKVADARFPQGKRMRAWGWSPKPSMCGHRSNS